MHLQRSGMSPAPILQSRRVTLTPSGAADLDDIVAMHRDRRVIGDLLDGIPDETWKARVYIGWAAGLHADGLGPWTARRSDTGRFLGLFTLTPYESDALEFGGRMARAGWTGDLAVEAGARLIDHGLMTLGKARLVSLHAPGNATATAALTRLGFTDPGPATVFSASAICVTLSAGHWRAQGRMPLPRARRPSRND